MYFEITKEWKGISCLFKGDYSYDPGRHTLDNGDPGTPPDESLDIRNIIVEGELETITNEMSGEGVYESAREHIIEDVREQYYG